MLLARTGAIFLLAVVAALFAADRARPAVTLHPAAVAVALQERQAWRFAEPYGAVEIDNGFSGARVSGCERVGPCDYKVVVSPENTPINPSPWYAFRVRSAVEREVMLRIAITSSKVRPWPYASRDGVRFERVAAGDYTGERGAAECLLRLRAGPSAVWIASNQPVGLDELSRWSGRVAGAAGAPMRTIGRSAAGRPIRAFELGAPDAPHALVVIGRQHPPEVAGSLGLMRFIEVVAGGSALAREFRGRYRVLCIPVVNPDGVHEGHWRSTLGAVDPNRDWGAFTQPETRCTRDAILSFSRTGGRRIELLLDFHATTKDIFYVPAPGAEVEPADFADRWIEAIQRRFPDEAVESSATNNIDEWTFKRWAAATFAAPGITYELGGAKSRDHIDRIVGGAAEEAMLLLLERAAAATGPR